MWNALYFIMPECQTAVSLECLTWAIPKGANPHTLLAKKSMLMNDHFYISRCATYIILWISFKQTKKSLKMNNTLCFLF
jgi:hypothetical protein